MELMYFDGAPCAVKAACTVLGGGKSGDRIKGLPIAIRCQEPGHETVDGGRGRCPDRHHTGPPALRPVRLTQAQGRTRCKRAGRHGRPAYPEERKR